MKDYLVFSINSNKKLAKDFAKFWNCQLGKIEVKKFADGEVLVKPLTDVKDKDVIIIESTAKKPNDCLFEILLLLDSIHRNNAKSVTLIIPYLGYSRQERVNYPNEPISCEVMAKLLETGHYDRLLTFDMHHHVIESFFSRGIKNVPTADIFANYYLGYLREHGIPLSEVLIVSPDHGANSRTDMLMFTMRGVKKAILEKVRPEADQVEHLELNGDVKGKTCIIYDDIISTGNTIVSATKLLKKNGAAHVLVGASHGVFAKGAVENIKKAGVDDLAITNTIEQEVPEGVKLLDVLQLIIENI